MKEYQITELAAFDLWGYLVEGIPIRKLSVDVLVDALEMQIEDKDHWDRLRKRVYCRKGT